MTKNLDQIYKEMTIEDIFKKFPSRAQLLAQEMTKLGLSCVGCSASTWETLEAGMLGHGMNEDDITSLVKRLNEILSVEIDDKTIKMTERAANKFKSILQEDNKEGWGLRFGDKPGGCGGFEYVLDFSEQKEADDVVFTSFGIEIYVNKEALDRLMGSQIDYLDGLNGSGFKITNPKVKSSCSCGNSQSY